MTDGSEPDYGEETVPRVALRILIAMVQGDEQAQAFWLGALHAAGVDVVLDAFKRLAVDHVLLLQLRLGDDTEQKLLTILHDQMGLGGS